MSPNWCLGHIHSHPAATVRVSDSQHPFPRARRVKNSVPFSWIHENPASLHTYSFQWIKLILFCLGNLVTLTKGLVDTNRGLDFIFTVNNWICTSHFLIVVGFIFKIGIQIQKYGFSFRRTKRLECRLKYQRRANLIWILWLNRVNCDCSQSYLLCDDFWSEPVVPPKCHIHFVHHTECLTELLFRFHSVILRGFDRIQD